MHLSDFYFGHDELFLIPIEHLSAAGMSELYAAELMRRRKLGQHWIDCFNRAFAEYQRRTQALYDAAPDNWFPPRAQNICIVSQPGVTRPYLQVFPAASWQLYQCDFEPDEASAQTPELATYLLLHAERLGLTQNAVTAFAHNIGYFLQRSDDELSLFCQQARQTNRPDGVAFAAFADLVPEVKRVYHPTLNPPPEPLPEPCGRLEAADLTVPRALQPALSQLARAAQGTAQQLVIRYFDRQRQGAGMQQAKQIADWLRTAAPRVLLRVAGETLWDPDQPTDTDALEHALADIGELPALALRADLQVIDERSRRFLASLAMPKALPQGEVFEQDGGVFIHEQRHLIVYDATAPTLNRLQEATAPYQRWLLGARTVHEWGHLAVEAGWVRVPSELAAAERQAREDVALLLRRLIRDAPPPYQQLAQHEQQQIGGAQAEPGALWTQFLFTRMPDFQTNLLARQFAEPNELEAYVRVNVRNHAQDGIGPYQQLMRHAFEYQYLSLSAIDDGLDYLLRSSWFDELFVRAGIISLERMQALWQAVARVCDCQRIDEGAFKPGSLTFRAPPPAP